jgi:RNA polymerase sigma-70 factor (ECF subfamily)
VHTAVPKEESGLLAQWFRDFRAPLRQFIAARRGVVAADVDDVAQEVFLRLLRYKRGELVADPRGYLFKVAANVVSEWSMRARMRMPHDSHWLEALPDDADVPAQVECADRNAELYHALCVLRPRAREVLRLHFEEGLTHNAIAARLGITPRIVKRDIIEAYAMLRTMLGRGGGSAQTGGVCVAGSGPR